MANDAEEVAGGEPEWRVGHGYDLHRLEALAPGAGAVARSAGSDSTVAEAEFDIDLLDAEEKK